MKRTMLTAPTVDTRVDYWPAMIDMLTSILMFFLLTYFVQQHLNPDSLRAATAYQKRLQFEGAFRAAFPVELASHEVALRAELGWTQITFGESVLFDSGEHALRQRGRTILARLARVFAATEAPGGPPPYDQIQIEGHTDDVPLGERSTYPTDNWELSTARALAVMKYMTHGVQSPLPERVMSVNGYAATRPVGSDRRKNRRIEVRVYFAGGQGAARPRAAVTR